MATRQRLSKNFIVEEFDCHDGTKVSARDYNGLKLLCRTYLEPLRAKYGSVTVLSGFRTISHNRQIGGASKSFHVYTIHDSNDQAADIRCVRGTPRDWHRTLSTIRARTFNGRGGLGLYNNFCHVDLRDYKSDWRG
jgi:zinc D-Ala-D-Ala carboxypeptidase